jgi:hypothetical protein
VRMTGKTISEVKMRLSVAIACITGQLVPCEVRPRVSKAQQSPAKPGNLLRNPQGVKPTEIQLLEQANDGRKMRMWSRGEDVE